MPDVAARWIDVASAVLNQDDVTVARRRLAEHLLHDFDARAGAHVTFDRQSGAFGVHAFPQEIAFDAMRWPYGVRTLERTHPLLLHYLRTGSLEPSQLLTPDQSPLVLPAPLLRLLSSLDIGVHQLALPTRNERDGVLEGYVLVREDPFPRWALPRAMALHDLVRGLDSHLRLVAAAATPSPRPEDEVGLTPREHTILAMLAESRTAESIGRSLGISARTVHKHLENVYRKLGVSDRVAAVTSAHRRGLVMMLDEEQAGGRPEATEPVRAPR